MPPDSCQGYASSNPAIPNVSNSGQSLLCELRTASFPVTSSPSVVLSSTVRHGNSRSFWGMYAKSSGCPTACFAIDEDVAGRRHVEPGDELEHGALAAPARSDDADELAAPGVQVDGLQDREATLLGGETLRHLHELERVGGPVRRRMSCGDSLIGAGPPLRSYENVPLQRLRSNVSV